MNRTKELGLTQKQTRNKNKAKNELNIKKLKNSLTKWIKYQKK
jgi:hypothetical protein